MNNNDATNIKTVDNNAGHRPKSWAERVGTTLALGMIGGGPLVAADESSNGAISKLYDDKYRGR